MSEQTISKKTWNRWSKESQDLFCNLYESIMLMGWHSFRHPRSPELSGEQFKTIAHNAAFMAANELYEMRRSKEITKE